MDLSGTRNVSLIFGKDPNPDAIVKGYVDADIAKDQDKGRSVTGCL